MPWKAKIFTVRLRSFSSYQFRGQAFSASRKYFFWRGLHGGACNHGSHLCVSSTRLLREAPRTQHVVHVCAWRARRGEQREKNGRGGRGKESGGRRGARKPVTSNYTARFIIYCRQFLLPPREGASDRRSKDDLCAGRSRIRAIDQWGCAHRVLIGRRSQFEFLSRSRPRSLLSLFYFLQLARRETRKTVLAWQLRGTIMTRVRAKKGKKKKKRTARCCIIGKRERDRGVRNAASRKNGVLLGERSDLAPCTPQDLYASWHFQIFNYRDARYCTESSPQKRNKSLAGRDILRARTRVHVPSSHIALYAHRYSSRAEPSERVDPGMHRVNAPIAASTRPEYRIQIESSWPSMKTLETRKLLLKLTVKPFNAAVPP